MPVVPAAAPPAPRPLPRATAAAASCPACSGRTAPSAQIQTSPAQFGSESLGNGGKGLSHPDGRRHHRPDQRTAGAASFANGFITVTLDNGQVWRQTAGAEAVGSLSRPASLYVAIISRGNFAGSYAMRLSGRAGDIAVRRIR